jgi:hypothetical protein
VASAAVGCGLGGLAAGVALAAGHGSAAVRVTGGLSSRLRLDPAGAVQCDYGQLSMAVRAGHGSAYAVGANLVGHPRTIGAQHRWAISTHGQANAYLRQEARYSWTSVRASKASSVTAKADWRSGSLDLYLIPVPPAKGVLHVTGSFTCAPGQTLKPSA